MTSFGRYWRGKRFDLKPEEGVYNGKDLGKRVVDENMMHLHVVQEIRRICLVWFDGEVVCSSTRFRKFGISADLMEGIHAIQW